MTAQPKVRLRDLYKIFGPEDKAVLAHVKAGLSKEDLLVQHNHVLGLQDINVDMQAGEITVVMGLSGSGKSTLIRHLNRLIEPTAGEILVDGEDVMQLSKDGLRGIRQNKMSMVFQKFALLPHRTVVQNAAMPLIVRGDDEDHCLAEATRWLDRVGLAGYEHHYPAQLSGGMQQRVGIARALTANTDIMLMDEAFSALDPLIRTDMQDLLLELQQELHKTIIFITHDLDEALKLAEDSLEKLIALSGGETGKLYRVMDGDAPIGQLDMRDLEATAPRHPQARQQQVARKIEIELATPVHSENVSQKNRQQIDAVLRYHRQRVHQKPETKGCNNRSQYGHVTSSRLKFNCAQASTAGRHREAESGC